MRIVVVAALGTLVATRAFAAGPTPPLEQNGWLIYQDSHITETANCPGRPVLLNGSHISFTLNGPCSYVRVAGEHNDISVQIGAAATIEITGAHNDVTWQQIVRGPPPRLIDSGASNTFHRFVPE
jgi:hypothetical protein